MSRLLNDLYNLAGKNNNKAISHYNLALSSMQQKNFANAIAYFHKSLKDDESGQMQSMIKPNLGLAYVMNGDFEKGIDELVGSLNLNNSNEGIAFIHANLGYAYSQLKNYGLAILEYRKSLKYSPNNAQTHYALGMLYESKFQSDLASAELEKSISLDPENQTYQDAYESLSNMAALSLKVGRTAQPLLNLGLIVTPSYSLLEKDYFPLIIYIYPESPLKKLAKEGDYIKFVEKNENNKDKSIMELLDVPDGTKLSMVINSSKVVITTIPKITKKLNEEEKIKLYRSWFYSFDNRIVSIFETKISKNKEEAGTKWGYEFESLIRSWSSYMKDPLFESAFALLMEFFQAYTYNDKPDEVHYEINLAKLNFSVITSTLINFFREIGFNESAKYFESKIKVNKPDLGNKPKKVGPIKTNMSDRKTK